MAGETSSTLELKVPIKRESAESNTLPYRVVPLKMDTITDSLTEENDNSVPVSPIFTSQVTENSGQRLALIASSDTPSNQNQAVIVSGGVLYLISEPPNVVTSSNRSATLPRTTDSSSSFGQRMSSKNEKRRVTHNEVERRRRDKINNWICRLAKVLPGSAEVMTAKNSNQVSKGVILSKACDHIDDLKKQVKSLTERLSASEAAAASSSSTSCGVGVEEANLSHEVEMLRKENEELRNSNALMKSTLLAHGIVLDS